jgi:hypothetical protein
MNRACLGLELHRLVKPLPRPLPPVDLPRWVCGGFGGDNARLFEGDAKMDARYRWERVRYASRRSRVNITRERATGHR